VAKGRKKPVIGILGGMCSGKSTVAAEFARLGCKVIDADKIAHEVLQNKAVREKIVSLLGRAILDSTGQIDRGKVAEVAFADTDKLSALDEIIHPLVLEQAEEFIRQYNRQSHVGAIVLDMPLLVEVGWAERCDKLIFVDCQREIRADRAKKMGIFDENKIKIRENFQISLDKKVEIADNVINNNSDFSALVSQVVKIFSNVVKSR
jgi:dephospho-CoA kinase